MTNEKKFNELLQNEEFMKDILQIETIQEVQNEFKKHGVNISEEEINQLGDMIEKVNNKLSTLSEDELNNITGGSSLSISESWDDNQEISFVPPSPLKVAHVPQVDTTATNSPTNKSNLSRGAIVGIAGASVAVAAGTGAGIYAWWKKKHRK